MEGSSYCIVATPVSVKVTTWPLHHAVLKGDLSADFQYGSVFPMTAFWIWEKKNKNSLFKEDRSPEQPHSETL